VLQGRVSDIKESFKENVYEVQLSEAPPPNLSDYASILFAREGLLRLKLAEGSDSNGLLRFLLNQGVHIRSFREVLPSLNEIFIRQVEGG
jgi:ABC-2 type transport system ATP-binding protein